MRFGETEESAVRFLDAGNLKAAERVLKRMLKRNPDSLPAHFHLTRVYRRTAQYHLALLHGRRTLRLNPEEPNACLNLAIVYDLMGDVRRARYYYKRELSRDPYNAETLWNLGRFEFEQHRWLAASKCLQRCLDVGLWTDIEETLYKLGYCYYKLNDSDAYIRAYERYLNVCPNAAWAAKNLGRALKHSKQYKRAALWLKRAYDLNPMGSTAQELLQARQRLARARSEDDQPSHNSGEKK